MIAARFRSVGWTGCVSVAALAFYLVSQSVAAKRAELAGVERKIASVNREIRQLQTEIGTRAGMAQIENWNSRVYGLRAPGAGQFVESSMKLVAMAQPLPLPLNPAIVASQGAVHQASYSAEGGDIVAVPASTKAARPAPAPAAPPAADMAEVRAAPMIQHANFVQPRAQAMTPQSAPVQAAKAARSGDGQVVRAAMLDEAWLADVVSIRDSARKGKLRP